MLLLFLISRQHNPTNQVFNTPNRVYMPLLPNGIIERCVILGYFISMVYQPFAMISRNERIFLLNVFGKCFFFTQCAKQVWL
jgi:hypothetical protein